MATLNRELSEEVNRINAKYANVKEEFAEMADARSGAWRHHFAQMATRNRELSEEVSRMNAKYANVKEEFAEMADAWRSGVASLRMERRKQALQIDKGPQGSRPS
ncbi:hypothetical protein HDU85_007054 [Gaertneriomyces sp. JEL0708]|nr:hypothetical protein HDU85_007054 [Gaertneriomyces sp. JEL0708]